ncbi:MULTISPECIES: DUF3316 domain-containing protein [Vibrio]|uniref:DUF3316 domain-containing protein n=1 Tax=Vibrio TaxID=662 RepID=UPI0021D2B8F8|nr:DUF3316 domain-containing protein [Vibrio sp. 2033]EIK0773550.1 DUF3316 domain-containing protein [Vibrio alginolyticus]MDW2125339.1 DUF3316 domain-containing protein [Vibrio sp. 2033]
MKKLMMLSSLLLFSLSATAGIHVEHSTNKVVLNDFMTKDAAYSSAFDLVDEYQTLSKHELRNRLNIIGSGFPRDIAIDDSKVRVEEYALNRDEVKYRAIINFDYHFRTSDGGKN